MKTTSLFCSLLISLLILSHPVLGQGNKQPAPCPTVNVTAPDSVEAGKQAIFTVNVKGGDTQVTPTYNWVVSTGAISGGQGTSVIKVDAPDDSTVTATVEVGGYNPNCPTTKSSTVMVLPKVKKVEARKLDEYGKLSPKEEKKRLGNFVMELMTDPAAQGYILVYSGRTEQATETQKAAKKIRTEVVKTAGLPADRLVMMIGGYRKQFGVELWLVPTGAAPPEPTPTVPESEIKSSGAKKPTKSKSSARRKR